LRGVLATDDTPAEKLVAEARALPTMAGLELASRVTCEKAYSWTRGSIELAAPWPEGDVATDAAPGQVGGASSNSSGNLSGATRATTGDEARHRVVAYDFGIKQNILRLLVDSRCDVTIVPA